MLTSVNNLEINKKKMTKSHNFKLYANILYPEHGKFSQGLPKVSSNNLRFLSKNSVNILMWK